VYGAGDAADRLRRCANWVNARRAEERVELVLVAGDLGSDRNLVRTILDTLTVPWVPARGDNSIQGGQEEAFDTDIAPQYAVLATQLANWTRAPVPVANPDTGGNSWFENFSFDHRGVHFIGLDWCTRTIGGIPGEQADLHAFAGGTWRFFRNDLRNCAKPRLENVVMLTHHPMHDFALGAGAFSSGEMNTIENFTAGYADNVSANLAGHYHFNWSEEREAGGFHVHVTDATWDDDVTLRLVRVFDDGTTFSYEHELVVLP
jgi:hypothetical protein